MNYAEKEAELRRIKLLSELRDSLRAATSSLDEYLNFLGTLEQPYDPSKISWVLADGPSGTYEKAALQEGSDYTALLKALGEHGGKMTLDGFFYWLFSDGSTVGRKPVGKK